ncbi:hypothetical protein KVF89_12410 [Nocardioides carbamazepini]|uniref:DUF1707 domain-containing protein n=1 Tax=Nocardioides carbamazepini TaxID=2854259 RepID=UPI0023578254|nr:DUF1707 domain-containing protein [Nocardioides carbamazepini]MCR1783339.1 hypothetical protein [Nocardioides carbamazepini]
MPEDTPHLRRLPDREPRDTERLAAVSALSDARARGEISQDDQLERTDMAVRVATLAELVELVEDLREPPRLPGPLPGRRAVLLGAVGLVAAGAGFAVLNRGDDPPRATPRPAPASSAPTPRPIPTPIPAPTPTPEPPPDIDLYSVAGLEVLFAEYHAALGTWKAYDVSVSDHTQASADAAVLPIRKRRLQWWSWSSDERWTTNFDPQVVTTVRKQVIDLRKVDLPAVIANIPRARRSANVEEPDAPGISFTYDPEYGGIVEFHISNQYSEVGTMTTDLAGRILERRPFVRS